MSNSLEEYLLLMNDIYQFKKLHCSAPLYLKGTALKLEISA